MKNQRNMKKFPKHAPLFSGFSATNFIPNFKQKIQKTHMCIARGALISDPLSEQFNKINPTP